MDELKVIKSISKSTCESTAHRVWCNLAHSWLSMICRILNLLFLKNHAAFATNHVACATRSLRHM